ncbi:complement resistance protein TraT [Alkalimonas collagenimarina]|uniref:Complement resistance protein TraT n=1 Tax=Alkalimonas collagenimarina TaxID=400390 RepID=A0ABT9H130_9GAMM|nr:complement resistance protein TraT [Alkalimonas collagenimarina]MDP4537000.1 complement resistance protein TraT [Alkalimonas collagenimarina]
MILRWFALAVALWLSGCSAIHTSIVKGDLDVQTRMSQTIYLDPVDPEQRTVFLDIRQTAAEFQHPIGQAVAELLLQRGYQVIDSPAMAQYWLQVNVRTVLKQSPEKVLAQPEYDMSEHDIAVLMNPALAALPPPLPDEAKAKQERRRSRSGSSNVYVGYSSGRNVSSKELRNTLFALAVIAGAEYAGRQMVQDVYYTMVTDIQVAEKLPLEEEQQVLEQSAHLLLQGDSGSTEQLWQRTLDRRKYQARIVSFANQANLDWQEAEPALQLGLMRSLAGIF